MISIEFVNNTSTNFEDIQCKTAYGFSFLTWFCCIWVLYIFLASGRLFTKPHCYTFLLILSQMVNALIHILWSSLTNNVVDINPQYSQAYVFFGLFAAFLTRCLPVSIMLNLISISEIRRYNQSKLNRLVFKLADSSFFITFIGIGLPLFCATLCLSIAGIPQKQG